MEENQGEREFFNSHGVRVTNARFVTPGETFAMRNITSVSKLRENPSRGLPIILALIGLVLLAYDSVGLGLVFCGAGIGLLIVMKPVFYVRLASSSGESKALKDPDESFIDSVIGALNDSIVHRG